MKRTFTIISYNNSMTPLPLEGVLTKLYLYQDLDFSNLISSDTSDENGETSFREDPAQFMVIRSKSGYYYDVQDIIVEDEDDQTFSDYGIIFNPTPTPERQICIVYGYLRDISDEGNNDPTIEVRLFTDDNVFASNFDKNIVGFPINVPVTEEGFWSIGLVSNILIEPKDSKYLFLFTWQSEEDNPKRKRYRALVTVPNRKQVSFAELLGNMFSQSHFFTSKARII